MVLQENTKKQIGDLEFKGSMWVTPELATEMLKKNFVNRPINKQRVEGYAYDMKKGGWEKIVDGIALQFDDEENLLNGQHRLHAVIKSGIPQEFFIFQKHISTTAMQLPFDTGAVRSLALITKQSSNYVSTITAFLCSGTEYNRCTPSMMTKFENSLTDDERELLDVIGHCNIKGFSAGVKMGFLFYVFTHKDKKKEMMDIWQSAIKNDYENPLACELREFARMRTSEWGGGENIRRRIFAYTYGILDGASERIYTSEKYKAERLRDMHWWMQGRV